MPRIAVIAIGGNSLIKDELHKSVADQYDAVVETARHIAGMVEQGYDVVITHGNGRTIPISRFGFSGMTGRRSTRCNRLGSRTLEALNPFGKVDCGTFTTLPISRFDLVSWHRFCISWLFGAAPKTLVSRRKI